MGEWREDHMTSSTNYERRESRGIFEFPPREGNHLKPILVRNPMSPKSNGEDPSPMWSIDTPSPVPPPPNNSYPTASRRSNTLSGPAPWEISHPPSKAGTLHPQDRWASLGGNELIALRSSTKSWSWCSTIYSLFTCCCCNIGGSIFGTIAVILSILAYSDHKVHDYKSSSKKRRISVCLASVGLVIGLLGLTLFLLAYFYVPGINASINSLFQSLTSINLVTQTVTTLSNSTKPTVTDT